MSKKVILVLLAVFFLCCICLLISGIMGVFLFSEEILSDHDNTLSQIEINEPTEYRITPIQNGFSESTEITNIPALSNTDEQSEYSTYMTELYDQLLFCQDAAIVFLDINDKFVADETLLYDPETIEEYQSALMQVSIDCTSFGVEENPPEGYEDINAEVILLNESALVFTENMITFIETKDLSYGEAGLIGLNSMNDHIEQLSILLSELSNEP